MSHKVRRDSHKQSGNLWTPAKGWLTHYRCSTCKEVMTRKIAAKCPQKIHACDHIVCANCIVKSFLIELNPICPVKDCGKCVNPRAKISTSAKPLPLFFSTTDDFYPDEESDDSFSFAAEHYLPSDLFDDSYSGCEQVHYCGDKECDWGCGTLDCGCIDQCRGRCGFRDSCGW